MKPRILAALTALLATVPANAVGASFDRAERATAERTERFIRAFERRDVRTLTPMIDPRATLVHPITFSGEQQPEARFVGREQVLGYFRGAFALMSRIDFVRERISVVAGGRTSFVQADGNFTTADGRPYNNVYLLRFAWRDGRIVYGEEYYNPVTFSETFGRPLG
jgi:ketosteroid isomerase-like protein